MEDRRQTVYQKLKGYFNTKDQVNVPTNLQNTKSIGVDKDILRTKSKEEYETKKLEKQQDKFLRGIWNKVNQIVNYVSLQNEALRYPSYLEYERMDEYPLIGAALDIYMEEATTADDKGKILHIYSNNEKVKEELNNLFYKIVNINTSLAMWTRNMCKYGDNFVYMDIVSDKGIVDVKQLPNIEIERVEGDYISYLQDNNKEKTYFRWKTSKTVEFKDWQILHFRLLSDDRRIPYGVSMLEKARRIWRNLILTEDAMRAIRLIRASDRRAFFIGVGNISDDDVQAYIEKIADRYKRKREIDPLTGQENLKYNVLAIDQDYFIPVRGADDGTKIDTLAGQSQLDIADIEYDLNLLSAALRIPRPYMNFAEAAADGKNLSMQDIRLARTINRIQQSLINELNKMAIIHLITINMEDELDNFSLALNNPSLQSELLKLEILQQKINMFNGLVDPTSSGISPMSFTSAKKMVFGFSDSEIMEDLKLQRFERAVGFELQKTEQIIERTGIFDDVDKRYGKMNAVYTATTDGTPTTPGGGGDMGGGGGFDMGGGGSGGPSFDFGGEDLGGEGEGGEEFGAEEGGGPEGAGPEEAAAPETTDELE
jgi:hypothetical protein